MDVIFTAVLGVNPQAFIGIGPVRTVMKDFSR